MEELVQPDKLRTRIKLWAQEETATGDLHESAGHVLDAILYRGELPRSDVADLLGTSDRTASRVIADLLRHGVVSSETERGPLHITFPAKLAARWLPGLFPEQRSPDLRHPARASPALPST
jgi:predicted HTH transcriptional regulator